MHPSFLFINVAEDFTVNCVKSFVLSKEDILYSSYSERGFSVILH